MQKTSFIESQLSNTKKNKKLLAYNEKLQTLYILRDRLTELITEYEDAKKKEFQKCS